MSLKYPHREGRRQRLRSLVTMVILRAAPNFPLTGTLVREGEGTTVGCAWVVPHWSLYLYSSSNKGGSQRGWGSFESLSRIGRKGSQPAQPTSQTSAPTKNLEVPCPQICPFWDGPQLELPVAVSFHQRGPPMEEGGVEGPLYLPLHFCGEMGEKELASHWVSWDLMNALSRLREPPHPPLLWLSVACSQITCPEEGPWRSGNAGGTGEGCLALESREYILCSVLAFCPLSWVSSVGWWKGGNAWAQWHAWEPCIFNFQVNIHWALQKQGNCLSAVRACVEQASTNPIQERKMGAGGLKREWGALVGYSTGFWLFTTPWPEPWDAPETHEERLGLG